MQIDEKDLAKGDIVELRRRQARDVAERKRRSRSETDAEAAGGEHVWVDAVGHVEPVEHDGRAEDFVQDGVAVLELVRAREHLQGELVRGHYDVGHR